ncbi:MAG: protein phosphatase 2C domain-containing protein [Oscillospiraceae bacterium]|nr:protein phosphatase 2C domain-containing protein [Oscillospiraceae bacterium]
MYNVYAKSVIGSSHIDKGTVCQDYSKSYSADLVDVSVFKSSHIENNKVSDDYSLNLDINGTHIAAVSDGHGSPQYFRSNKGAMFAVESAVECLCKFSECFSDKPEETKLSINELLDKNEQPGIMNQLFKSIMYRWYEKVEEDYAENPFTESELNGLEDKYRERYKSGKYLSAYGATLIAAIVTENYWLGIHLGDGKFLSIDENGEWTQPIPWDDDCVSNVTTSICQKDALDKFRYFISDNMPVAICFGSDGIDDTYGDGQLLEAFYGQLLLEFEQEGYSKTVEEIEELMPDITRNGSHDDVSVAMIFNTTKIKHIAEVLSLKIKKIKLEDEAERYIEKINRAKKKVTLIKNDIAENNQRLTDNRGNVYIVQNEIEKLTEKLYKLHEKIEECEKSSDKCITDILTNFVKAKRHDEDISYVSVIVDTLSEVDELIHICEISINTYSELSKRIKKELMGFSDMKEVLDEKKKILENLQDKNIELNIEQKRLNSEHDKANRKVSEIKAEYGNNLNEIEEITKKLEQIQKNKKSC